MRHLIVASAMAALSWLAIADDDGDQLKQQIPNQQHRQQVQERIQRFYQVDDMEQADTKSQLQQQLKETINVKPTKYSLQTGQTTEQQVQTMQRQLQEVQKKLQQNRSAQEKQQLEQQQAQLQKQLQRRQRFTLQGQQQQIEQQLKDNPDAEQQKQLQQQLDEVKKLQGQQQRNPLVQAGQAKLMKQYQHQQGQVVSSKQQVQGLEEELKHVQQQAKQEKDPKQQKQLQQQQEQLAKQLQKVRKFQTDEGRAGIEGNDQVADLAAGWVGEHDLVTDMNSISSDKLRAGKATTLPWSDDYWALADGATSYRYAAGKNFTDFGKSVLSYLQPDAWVAQKDMSMLSPAEKYDIAVGDVGNKGFGTVKSVNELNKVLTDFNTYPGFTLTRMEKNTGMSYYLSSHKVETWMGICHGWAPAAVKVPRPTKEVTVTGANGAKVTFYPHDIRALASLAWANGNAGSNFIGGRCNSQKPQLLKNGRVAEQDCFDNNPATWTLSLVNFIGKEKQAFIGDATWDYEVWNNPIVQYELSFFNPTKPGQTFKDWKKAAVAYNDPKFVKADRFRMGGKGSPTYTRGKLSRGRSNEKDISKVVGVVATVHWTAEVDPKTGAPAEDDYNVETYTYDLELHCSGEDSCQPIGGEWHTNVHPDFLWASRKGAVAKTSFDSVQLNYNGTANAQTVAQARKASQENYPLYQVLKYLVKQSSGKDY